MAGDAVVKSIPLRPLARRYLARVADETVREQQERLFNESRSYRERDEEILEGIVRARNEQYEAVVNRWYGRGGY
jgi:hypothetical protein